MNFLNHEPSSLKQVIILGAGMDTMYFRMAMKSSLNNNCKLYVELDFPEITMEKILVYKKNFQHFGPFLGCENSLQQFQQNISKDFTCYSSKSSIEKMRYHLIACDLRNLQDLEKKFQDIGIDPKVPTLFISECVLIYMESAFSKALIEWTTTHFFFQDLSYVLYEQILPDDPFGRVMMKNIKARGCELLSIQEYPTIESQIKRFQDLGFHFVQCWNMKEIYYHYLETNDRLK
jgi:O-methyltransferase involved in polyketide biosynthesis